MSEQEFFAQYCIKVNPSQMQAVQAVGGPVLLLAVPGSGKTTVLVTRLGYMVCCCGIAPERILIPNAISRSAISYNQKVRKCHTRKTIEYLTKRYARVVLDS